MRKIVTFILLSFLITAAFAQYEAPDPSRTTPNARVLGMGRAYLGLADDAAAIFTNPAGLATIANWQMTSMSGNFMDEYSYLSFSGLYPTTLGVLGVGFMGSSIAGAFSTMQDPNSSDEDPIYIVDPSQPPINYINNVTVLAYASKLSRFIKQLGWADKIAFGLNLKLFTSALTGDAITEGSASGIELDLGVKAASPWPWLNLGAKVQNLLPGSMGGRLRYESGHEESYPMIIAVGGALNLLGAKETLLTHPQQELLLLFDYYLHPTLSILPPTMHFGVEYKPIPMIAIRAGIDQDVMGDGYGTSISTVNDITSGVGLTIAGFRFDYAYHQFASVPDIANSYFSFAYGFHPKVAPGPSLVIKEPQDEWITFDNLVAISGQAFDPRIKMITINGILVKLDLKGKFSTKVSLKEGKNKITLVAMDNDQKPLKSTDFRILRLKAFPDVAEKYWVAQPISILSMAEFIKGYPNGKFKPEGTINRAEMCTLLMKAQGFKPEKGAINTEFKDVNKKHWAAPYIQEAAERRIVKGYPDGSFRPKKKITRAEGVALITRFASISQEAFSGQFPDIKLRHWSANIIAGAHSAGILKFIENKAFKPKQLLTRAETVDTLPHAVCSRSACQGSTSLGIVLN